MKAPYLCVMWHGSRDINYSFHQVLMERLFLESKGKAWEVYEQLHFNQAAGT